MGFIDDTGSAEEKRKGKAIADGLAAGRQSMSAAFVAKAAGLETTAAQQSCMDKKVGSGGQVAGPINITWYYYLALDWHQYYINYMITYPATYPATYPVPAIRLLSLIHI